MPRYEIVAHVSVELEDGTPEAAAERFKQTLRAGGDGSTALRGLVVWRPSPASIPAAVTPAVQQHLADFFAGVADCAATAEEAFRVRVEEIFATPAPEAAADALAAQSRSVVVERPAGYGRETEDWEEEGGAIAPGSARFGSHVAAHTTGGQTR